MAARPSREEGGQGGQGVALGRPLRVGRIRKAGEHKPEAMQARHGRAAEKSRRWG